MPSPIERFERLATLWSRTLAAGVAGPGAAHHRGDLYARWGVLGVGLHLYGERRQWHLPGARQRYDAQPGLLP